MSDYAYSATPHRPGPIRRTLTWLDERGPLSWVVVMVGSFIFAGPLGLLVLGFILMTGRFRGANCRRRAEGSAEGFGAGFGAHRCGGRMHFHASRSTGNAAFDAYKADTLARLEREQDAFEAFLGRLREARDKAEFDQYMQDRASAETRANTAQPETRPETRPETQAAGQPAAPEAGKY